MAMAIDGRLLHFMIHVGDIDRSIAFYTDVLGMRVLRRGEFPEEGRRNAFVGYGEEATTSVIELTAWRDKPAYQHGTAFGHLAIGVADIAAACAALRAAGARIVREPWTVPSGTVRVAFAEDPDGYQIELVQRL
jgi:lactoylglutathione lyase